MCKVENYLPHLFTNLNKKMEQIKTLPNVQSNQKTDRDSSSSFIINENFNEDFYVGFEGNICETYVNKTQRRPESYLSKEDGISSVGRNL